MAKGWVGTKYGKGLGRNQIWQRVGQEPNMAKGWVGTKYGKGLGRNQIWQRVGKKPNMAKSWAGTELMQQNNFALDCSLSKSG